MDLNIRDPEASLPNLDIATSQIGVWEIDLATGEASRNLRHDQLFGYIDKCGSWSMDIFLTHVVERDRTRIAGIMNRSVKNDISFTFETEIVSVQGDRRWISATGQPKIDADGKATHMVGHVIDTTAAHRREEGIRQLTEELGHRAANTVAAIQAMVRTTSKTAGNLAEFVSDLSDRLDTIAQADRLLTNDPDTSVFVRSIFDGTMRHFDDLRDRVSLHGRPATAVPPHAAHGLTLVLHELMSNAVRHGALSNDSGLVEINVDHGGDGSVRIHWQEMGGPAVSQPGQKGYGTAVINSALSGNGTATQHFAPGGLLTELILGRQLPDNTPRPRSEATRVLLVEDETLIGMDLKLTLESHGFVVDGPHSTVETAMAALTVLPDIALLDVNLGKHTSDAVADRLRENAVPFVVLSGRTSAGSLSPAYAGAPIIHKPHDVADMLNMLRLLAAEHGLRV